MTRFVKSFAAAVCACALGPHIAEGNAMRGSDPAVLGRMRVEDLRAAMLDELMGALGNSSRVTQQRLSNIETILSPTFQSMPKNEYGNLDSASVRYVLHRLFVQRHGMYIKGLEPGGEAWNASSATEVLEDRVPLVVQSLFEDRLQGHGLGMHEIAILAATLEHLIHDEALDRLKVSYQALDISMEGKVGRRETRELVDTYMMLFILGKNVSVMTLDDIREEQKTIHRVYPGWSETQKFADEVRDTVSAVNAADPNFANGRFTFTGVSQVVEEIGERYGRWQDAECRDLKSELMKMEHQGSGRVLLKDFYGQALGGAWQFSESIEYLRELGALDDTDPNQMSVLIPNYVNSKSNCVASSSIYSVCCLNECESLLGYLESEIATPEASPERIMELVSGLSSATVEAPRELAADLRSRLNEVAEHHGGQVPLHGRLFAQWLHHAYPRECPFPHLSGTTNPMTADEWMVEKGAQSVAATKLEMQSHAETAAPAEPASADEAPATAAPATAAPAPLMWKLEEELIAAKPQKSRSFMRTAAALAAAAAILVALAGSMSSGFTALHGRNAKEKDMLLPTFSRKTHVC